MEIKAVCLDKRDNVVTCTQAARQGDVVTWRGCTAGVTPAGHGAKQVNVPKPAQHIGPRLNPTSGARHAPKHLPIS